MGILELFILAVGLSMDAFAVSICKGLALPRLRIRHCVIVGLWFGLFQALMPLIGFFLGVQFKGYITAVDHWIAFALLAVIGGKMVKEALEGWNGDKAGEEADASLNFTTMLILAVATSIDALAMGVTFAFLEVDVVPAVSFIGIVTFVLSAAGVKVGSVFGTKYKAKAELLGGVILVLLGCKILLEHLGVL